MASRFDQLQRQTLVVQTPPLPIRFVRPLDSSVLCVLFFKLIFMKINFFIKNYSVFYF